MGLGRPSPSRYYEEAHRLHPLQRARRNARPRNPALDRHKVESPSRSLSRLGLAREQLDEKSVRVGDDSIAVP